jgi:hypothetical protein
MNAAATLMILALIAPSYVVAAGTASERVPGKVPPIAPAANEIPVAGVAVWSIHQELQQCMKDAATTLTGVAHNALHARIGEAHAFVNPVWGYVLRADFTREDVSPPLINRIICWRDGQIIVSRVSTPPLPSVESERPVAVPQKRPR